MAYADQQGMSTSRMVSIGIVVLLHAFLGYAFVTGLAYEAVQEAKKKLNVIDVKEEEPPEEEEPPPPPEPIEVAPPPVATTQSPVPSPVAVPRPPPSPIVPFNPAPPSPAPVAPRPAPPPPPPPPPPAPPPPQRPNPIPKGNPGNWVTTNDYPRRALQQEREGTTRFRLTVGANGRVTDCDVTGSSGHGDLDAETCDQLRRRARFDPKLDSQGNPTTGVYSNSVRWQIPK